LSPWKKTCGCVSSDLDSFTYICHWDLWAVMNAGDLNLLQGTKKLINEDLSIFSLWDYCSQGSPSMSGSHSVSLFTKSVIYLPRVGGWQSVLNWSSVKVPIRQWLGHLQVMPLSTHRQTIQCFQIPDSLVGVRTVW